MRKLFYALLIIFVVAALVWSFKPASKYEGKVTIINPAGPAIIPVAGLANGKISSKTPVEVKYWKSNDEVQALLSTNGVDFAVLPVTVAANLYAKGIDLVMLGVHEWKVFYLISADNNPFTGWESFKGKTIYTPEGKGQTADVLMRAALTKSGLTPDKDVTILYASPQDIVALFKAGKITYAALPEPFVTLAIADNKGQIILDFQKYWAELTGNPERLPIAGLFVKREFYKKYSNDTNNIALAVSESTEWGNENLDQALDLSKTLLPIPPAVLKTAYERMSFQYIKTDDCKKEVQSYLEKMHDFYPEGLAGLPDKGFYQP